MHSYDKCVSRNILLYLAFINEIFQREEIIEAWYRKIFSCWATLSVSLSLCLFVSLSFCLFVILSLCLFVYLSLCLFLYLSVFLCLSLSWEKEMGSYNVTYRQTYRPSDEAGPRGAFASNNMGFLSGCTTNHKKMNH